MLFYYTATLFLITLFILYILCLYQSISISYLFFYYIVIFFTIIIAYCNISILWLLWHRNVPVCRTIKRIFILLPKSISSVWNWTFVWKWRWTKRFMLIWKYANTNTSWVPPKTNDSALHLVPVDECCPLLHSDAVHLFTSFSGLWFDFDVAIFPRQYIHLSRTIRL